MRSRSVLIAAAAVLLGDVLPTGAAAAVAVGACPAVGPVSTVVRGSQFLEGSAFDAAGRLVYDDWISGAVGALDTPTSRPRSLGTLTFPGGMAQAADGRLVISEGNGFGPLVGGSWVSLLDTTTGAKTKVVSQVAGANGLARAADGTIYAADTLSGAIDRVAPDGTVTRSWWRGSGGPNGMTLSADGHTLFMTLTFSSRVVAIDTDSRAVRTIYRAEGLLPWLDGIAVDGSGRLYVALYLVGEVHRLDPATGAACRLARGLRSPTSVAFAPEAGDFDQASAYVTTSGAIKRIAAAVPTAT